MEKRILKHILLPLDLQDTALSERAIKVAQDISQQYGADITVLTVIPDFGMPLVANFFPEDTMEHAKKEVRVELKRLIDDKFDQPDKIKSDVLEGSPHKEIVRYAKRHATNLIIVPARATNVGKVFLGSSSTHVVERAPCSVLVIRP